MASVCRKISPGMDSNQAYKTVVLLKIFYKYNLILKPFLDGSEKLLLETIVMFTPKSRQHSDTTTSLTVRNVREMH